MNWEATNCTARERVGSSRCWECPTPYAYGPRLDLTGYFLSGCAFSSAEGVPMRLITAMSWYNRPKSL